MPYIYVDFHKEATQKIGSVSSPLCPAQLNPVATLFKSITAKNLSDLHIFDTESRAHVSPSKNCFYFMISFANEAWRVICIPHFCFISSRIAYHHTMFSSVPRVFAYIYLNQNLEKHQGFGLVLLHICVERLLIQTYMLQSRC